MERWLIKKKVMVRPDESGGFDELLLFDGKKCLVHVEMMDSNRMWIGIYPEGSKEQVMMWVSAKGKLRITTEPE
jgi:hypothetical protein